MHAALRFPVAYAVWCAVAQRAGLPHAPLPVGTFHGVTPSSCPFDCLQLSLAWCAHNPNVSTVITGATKVSQVCWATDDSMAVTTRACQQRNATSAVWVSVANSGSEGGSKLTSKNERIAARNRRHADRGQHGCAGGAAKADGRCGGKD